MRRLFEVCQAPSTGLNRFVIFWVFSPGTCCTSATRVTRRHAALRRIAATIRVDPALAALRRWAIWGLTSRKRFFEIQYASMAYPSPSTQFVASRLEQGLAAHRAGDIGRALDAYREVLDM